MIRQTSIQTYNEIISSGLLSDKRLKVYDILYTHPQGLTGSEVSTIFKGRYPTSNNSETIRNRITELVKMGVAYEVGVVQCPISKRNVLKFSLTDNLPVKLDKVVSKKKKVDNALNEIMSYALEEKDENKLKRLRVIYRLIHELK